MLPRDTEKVLTKDVRSLRCLRAHSIHAVLPPDKVFRPATRQDVHPRITYY